MQRVQCHNMQMAVDMLKGYQIYLRQCTTMVENAVGLLGVPHTYTLLSKLNETYDGLTRIQEVWKDYTTADTEVSCMKDDLVAALVTSCTTLRTRHDANEAELKQMVSERDRNNAVIDESIMYLHSIMAEHTHWQERYGYNAQQLPMFTPPEHKASSAEDETNVAISASAASVPVPSLSDPRESANASHDYLDKCHVALSSLYRLRHVHVEETAAMRAARAAMLACANTLHNPHRASAAMTECGAPAAGMSVTKNPHASSVMCGDTHQSRPRNDGSASYHVNHANINSSPVSASTANSDIGHHHGDGNTCVSAMEGATKWTAPSMPVHLPPVSRPRSFAVDEPTAVVRRWCEAARVRSGTSLPYTRLHYVPPQHEVDLLRRALDMGLGSRVLMMDVQRAWADLRTTRASIRAEATHLWAELTAVKKELFMLRAYLAELVRSGIPFQIHTHEIVSRLMKCIQMEVQKQLCGGESGAMTAAWMHDGRRARDSLVSVTFGDVAAPEVSEERGGQADAAATSPAVENEQQSV